MNPAMRGVCESYDYPIHDLIAFFCQLNTPITYPDGMQVSLDTLYWGKEQHYPAFLSAMPQLEDQGLARFSEYVSLYDMDAVRLVLDHPQQ
jgi:hypothetical protein